MRPMAAIIVAELLATGRLSTRRFQAFDAGKIWQWLSGGMAIGLGVGRGGGLGRRGRIRRSARPGARAGLGSGRAGPCGRRRWTSARGLLRTRSCPRRRAEGAARRDQGERARGQARGDRGGRTAIGGGLRWPRPEGAQAAIRATTSAAADRDRMVGFGSRVEGIPGGPGRSASDRPARARGHGYAAMLSRRRSAASPGSRRGAGRSWPAGCPSRSAAGRRSR